MPFDFYLIYLQKREKMTFCIKRRKKKTKEKKI